MRNDTDPEFATLHEFVKKARLNLNQNIWDYLIGGTETETTVARNRQALDSVAFRPRVLRNVSRIDPTGDFFGVKTRLPVLLAPVGSLESFDPAGGAAVAEAAARYGVPMFASSVTQPGLEQIAATGAGLKVFQLYVRGDAMFVDDHAQRAIDAGYDAFCITVDTAVYSRRERDLAKRFKKYWRAHEEVAMQFQSALDWDDIARFKAKHRIKLILKGIASTEDAERACELGVEGIYVSNHGGRQLDHGRGCLEMLPEIVAAVAGRAKVLVDGGFSRGTDVVKAMAMGAHAVGLGRLYVYGLAAAGVEGVVRVLELLEAEIVETLGLLGVTTIAELRPEHLRPAHPVTAPHVHSAFPLLNLRDSGY